MELQTFINTNNNYIETIKTKQDNKHKKTLRHLTVNLVKHDLT